MSILDLGLPQGDDLAQTLEKVAPLVEQVLEELGLANDDIIQKAKEGISPHIAYGLSDDHLDAIFATGIRFMQAGDVQKAQDVFLKLTTLNSMDARFNYALGTTFQMQGQYAGAAKIYMIALALDAMNVDGYLRVGECLLAADEREQAQEAFEAAISLCEHGAGTPENLDLAKRMVAHVQDVSKPQT